MGGGGAHSAPSVTLRGAASFVRHNPRSDKFEVRRFHSLEFWCSDATTTYKRFQHALGMTLVAKSDLSTGNSLYASYVLKSNDLVFVFTAPYSRSAWQYSPEPRVPLPQYSQQAAHEFVMSHGLGVRAVVVEVGDAAEAFHTSVANGAIPVLEPTLLEDDVDSSCCTVAEVKLYGDVVMRYVSGTLHGPFLPKYQTLTSEPKICYGVTRLDHAVGNVPNLLETVNYIVGFTGFHQFAEFTAEDVGTVDSGLNSMVLASNNEMVLLPINEPTHGTPRKSQIQTFLEQNEGPGMQHLALKTNDIFKTLKEMQSRSAMGGFEFMPRPSARYYKELPNKIGDALTPQQYKMLEEMGILADKDDQGVLLQIFTKPLGDRPTIFIEIIERIGCLREKATAAVAAAAPNGSTSTTTAAAATFVAAAASDAASKGITNTENGDTTAAGGGTGSPTGAAAVGRLIKAVQGMEVDIERDKVRVHGDSAAVAEAEAAAAAVVALEQAAGCGGFGKGNFSELFKRIEDYERTLSIQK